jgi:hypothetical protein
LQEALSSMLNAATARMPDKFIQCFLQIYVPASAGCPADLPAWISRSLYIYPFTCAPARQQGGLQGNLTGLTRVASIADPLPTANHIT